MNAAISTLAIEASVGSTVVKTYQVKILIDQARGYRPVDDELCVGISIIHQSE
jgi:hypothetical protein